MRFVFAIVMSLAATTLIGVRALADAPFESIACSSIGDTSVVDLGGDGCSASTLAVCLGVQHGGSCDSGGVTWCSTSNGVCSGNYFCGITGASCMSQGLTVALDGTGYGTISIGTSDQHGQQLAVSIAGNAECHGNACVALSPVHGSCTGNFCIAAFSDCTGTSCIATGLNAVCTGDNCFALGIESATCDGSGCISVSSEAVCAKGTCTPL